MKGLLIKDAILIKKYCLFHFVISLIFFAISIFDDSNLFFAYYAVSIVSIIPITISAYDEQCRWNAYETILPISRKQSVAEKYIITACIIVPVTVIYSFIMLFVKKESLSDMLLNISIMFLCGVIPPSIVLPIIFKFGYLKGRTINFIIIAIFAAMISFTSLGYVSTVDNQLQFNAVMVLIMVIAAAVVFILSMLISSAVYRKKEF